MLIIKIVNDGTGQDDSSADNSVANYRYQVMVNDHVIESGEVKGHNRSGSWISLVELMIIQRQKHILENLANSVYKDE